MKVTEKDREAARACYDGPNDVGIDRIAEAIAAAYVRGLEDAAKAVRASLPRAHTYASESADLYRAQDAIIERAIAAICKLGEDA